MLHRASLLANDEMVVALVGNLCRKVVEVDTTIPAKSVSSLAAGRPGLQD
jgi:hypothetical protein